MHHKEVDMSGDASADAKAAEAQKELEAAEALAAEAVEQKDLEESAFDKERAMRTIKDQRKAEKALEQKLKEMSDQLAGYKTAEEKKAEAEKTLEAKVAEGQGALEAKDVEIADLHVRHDFEAKAALAGIEDPALAFLAAKQEGLLGTYNPKEGGVTDHDFEELGVKYPSFASTKVSDSGDAGARGRGKTATTKQQFNDAIRGAIGR